MKRILLTLLAGLLALNLSAQQLDSTRRAALGAKLEEYCAALLGEPAAQQCEETDFIIGSCEDEATRQFVAVWMYDHYYKSKVMGHDAVAIHIYDKWFDKGGLKMYDEISQLTAAIFADFNRQSLIGSKAPAVTLKDSDGNDVTIYAKASGRVSVLYFYSPDCAKCKIENIMVRNVIENRDCPVDVYAVCTSDDRTKWEELTTGSLCFSVSNTSVHHLWDPEGNKGWQHSYGVLQTPKLFLVDADGTILGRAMDSYALDRMLDAMFTPVQMVYGEDESIVFYNDIFESYRKENGRVSSENLAAVADHIATRTLEEARDTMLYKQLTGDLLYYLSNNGESGLRNGISDFTQKHILSRSDIWNTEDDSLQVVGLARMMKEVADRASVGSKLPSVVVYGSKSTRLREGKTRTWDLSRLPRRIEYVMFYSPLCQDCQEELEALSQRHAAKEKLRVLKVDMDNMDENHPDEAQTVMDSFDLITFPYITKLDAQGAVAEKYCSFK